MSKRCPAGCYRILWFALALAMGGCASFAVQDAQPLAASQLAPEGAETISQGGYRLSALPAATATPDLIVMVAMSGGGKRSASFGYGALKGMREVMLQTSAGPRPLLSQVDIMSGVSGGSFPVSYYGLYRDRAFGRFETDFLYSDTNSYIFGIYLLPWNWGWLVQPGIGTNDYMDRVYDRTMFHGATFADLAARGRPLIAIGATDISFGTPFTFTQEQFDLTCSNLLAMPVSRAVAASNGFPGLFSPVTLTNHAGECGGRRPGWLRRISPAERQDPLSRTGAEAIKAERYLDASRVRYLHLSDGGVSDNLAMRGAGGAMQTISESDLKTRRLIGVRRLLVISIDGQGTQDSSVAERKEVGGLFALLGLVSGGQIDSYNFETLTTVSQQVQALAAKLRAARCGQAPVIDGAPCGDVEAATLHLSLAAMQDSAARDKLLAIPTGLSLQRAEVDLLVNAGHDAVTNSAALRKFLDGYAQTPAGMVRTAGIEPARP